MSELCLWYADACALVPDIERRVNRCPDALHDGYYTEPVKYIVVVKRKKRFSVFVQNFPCERLGKMRFFSDLSTNHAKERIANVLLEGYENWYAKYKERADLLTIALERYNNGGIKGSFDCLYRGISKSARNHASGRNPLRKPKKEKGKRFKESWNRYSKDVIKRGEVRMMSELSAPSWIGLLSIFNILLFIAIIAAGVYCFILFVRLAHLGINALRIYIDKNK